MRVVKRSIQVGGEGFVKLVPEESEDLWNIYHLIVPGDRVKGVTFRFVLFICNQH